MDAYLFLAVSLLPLAAGPLIARFASRSGATAAALDGFIAVTVGGIALVHILPHAYLGAGAAALAAGVVGFLMPIGLERWRQWRRGARSGLLLVAFLGLGFHSVLDGVALFGPQAEEELLRGASPAAGEVETVRDSGEAPAAGGERRHASASLLALAVVLHRFPVALAIWWLASPVVGRRIAAALLITIGVATVVGFAAGDRIWLALPSPGIGILQAAIAGMLLHVVLGHRDAGAPLDASRAPRAASALGALVGLGIVAAMAGIHPFEQRLADELSAEAAFVTLALAAAPDLVLAYVALGLLYAFLPRDRRTRLFGIPEPRSSPLAACFLLAVRPELQLPGLVLSMVLLGPAWTLTRLLSVLVVAGLTALSIKKLLEAAVRKDGVLAAAEEPDNRTAPPLDRRLQAALRFGFGAAVDRTAPWLLLGLGIAAFVEPMVSAAPVRELLQPAQLAVMALLGLPLYLLGLGATPIVAVLAHKGIAFGPLLAFLLAGVAAAGFRPLSRRFGRRLAWSFAARMLLLALICGYAFDLPGGAWDLHEAASRGPGPLEVGAGLVLLGLFLASLFRRGFRGFVRPSAEPVLPV